MKAVKKDVHWIVQKNLTSPGDKYGLEQACIVAGVGFEEVEVIPFTDHLPQFEIRSSNIYYGSTTFNKLLYDNTKTRKGLFFDEESFSLENYMKRWGKHMLNYGSEVTTFKELMEQSYDDDKLLFIRPDADTKAFAGEVIRFSEIKEWYEGFTRISAVDFSEHSKIIVANPYNIKYEWRLWIIEKKVVAASKYREYFKLNKEKSCPPEVVSFAEQRCGEYTPHDVFVMDICLCGDDYYIVECGCMNAAGFYKADIESIVRGVTGYFRTKYVSPKHQ